MAGGKIENLENHVDTIRLEWFPVLDVPRKRFGRTSPGLQGKAILLQGQRSYPP